LQWIKILIGLAVLRASALQAQITTLRVAYDDFCPFTCVNAPQKGFLIDVLERILEPKGFKLQTIEASWPRIKVMSKKGELDLIPLLYRSEAKDLNILATDVSIGSSDIALFVHKNSVWTYSGINSLAGQIIGILQDYTYPEPLSTLLNDPVSGKNQIIMASEHGTERQIKMLASKRVSIIPAQRMVFWYKAHKERKESLFREAGALSAPKGMENFYMGIASKRQPLAQDLKKWIDQGVKELNKSGEFQKIIETYGIPNSM